MDDEAILDYCMTDYWSWIVTDRRLIKYRQEPRGGEQLHDLSFDEITSASLVNKGRKDQLAGYGIFALLGALVAFFFRSAWTILLGFLLLAVSGYLFYWWANSDEAYFQFRGSGLLQEQPDTWQIDESLADNPGEIREFVKTVREQL